MHNKEVWLESFYKGKPMRMQALEDVNKKMKNHLQRVELVLHLHPQSQKVLYHFLESHPFPALWENAKVIVALK